MPYIKLCRKCSKKFYSEKNGNKFCSMKCFRIFRKVKPKNCRLCKKVFCSRKNRIKFCTHKCSQKYQAVVGNRRLEKNQAFTTGLSTYDNSLYIMTRKFLAEIGISIKSFNKELISLVALLINTRRHINEIRSNH